MWKTLEKSQKCDFKQQQTVPNWKVGFKKNDKELKIYLSHRRVAKTFTFPFAKG